MKPDISYARTDDGLEIACWSMGEGEPLVEMPPIRFSHAALEWDFPEIREWYARLAVPVVTVGQMREVDGNSYLSFYESG